MIEQLLTHYPQKTLLPPAEFRGEVATEGFINGLELASAINLTRGTAQHTDSPWLHFILDDVELYVAKKTYRHSISWNHINAVDAVFGTTIEIKGKAYKVRLLKSVASGDMYTGGTNIYDPEEAYGSEWNRLMYPIHSGNHIESRNPSSVSGEGLHFGTLAQYTDADLVVHLDVGNGSYSWCQETASTDTRGRVRHGHRGVSSLGWSPASNATAYFGWRPVLELVS